MKIGKIEFGHCTEPIKIKGKVALSNFVECGEKDRPDYVVPQFSQRCDKLSKKLDAVIDNIHRTPWSERDKPCVNPYPQKQDALSRQVGGSHYKQYKIQPYEFFIANQIPHHKAAIIRRILRYDHPTGKGLEDLKKIQHEVELIIQLENWEAKSGEPTAEKKG